MASDYSKLRPLGDRVLVRRLAVGLVAESGLYIGDYDKPTLGHVLAVGPKVTDVAPGDLVQWSRKLIEWSVDKLGGFELPQIADDLFLFNYDDLNFVGRE